MRNNIPDNIAIFTLIFSACFLIGLLFFRFGLISDTDKYKDNRVVKNQSLEKIELLGKVQKLSINGYNLKTTTACFNGTEMMFAFYVDDMEIVNLNKPCGEIK